MSGADNFWDLGFVDGSAAYLLESPPSDVLTDDLSDGLSYQVAMLDDPSGSPSSTTSFDDEPSPTASDSEFSSSPGDADEFSADDEGSTTLYDGSPEAYMPLLTPEPTTPITAARPKRVAAVAAAAVTAAAVAASASGSSRPEPKLRVGRFEVSEDQLMTMDLDALQKLAGHRFSSSDKSTIKMLRRKVKNKRSAATSRQKKREEKVDLENELSVMRQEKEELRRLKEALETENATLRREICSLRSVGVERPVSYVMQPQATSLAASHLFGKRQTTAVMLALLFSFGVFFTFVPPSMVGGGAQELAVPAAALNFAGNQQLSPDMHSRRLMLLLKDDMDSPTTYGHPVHEFRYDDLDHNDTMIEVVPVVDCQNTNNIILPASCALAS